MTRRAAETSSDRVYAAALSVETVRFADRRGADRESDPGEPASPIPLPG